MTEAISSISSNTLEQAKKEQAEHEEKPPHSHWHAEEIANLSDDCPECKAEKEKLAKIFGEKYMNEHWREKLPNVCSNCGEGVLLDEKECVKCHGTKARKRN
jgi:hypothetical protein